MCWELMGPEEEASKNLLPSTSSILQSRTSLLTSSSSFMNLYASSLSLPDLKTFITFTFLLLL